MTPDEWQRIKTVLDGALLERPEARASYLDRACGDDVEMRHEVESLLAAHREAGTGFLETPVARLGPSRAAAGRGPTRTGRRIGPYDVREEIGHGGMGEVYRAVRADGQFTKEVALKIVRTGFDTGFVVERFRQERQILAGLDHPNIARLLDGGTTDDGVPYLVMEMVEGVPIDAYCEAHHLTTAQRLRLFQQVCAAVHYAHQHLVVHRDIKPSNILVTGEGIPKLLDFGIAKILDAAPGLDATVGRAMTPEYASPEQIRGVPITTASDVYSLGVVLHVLLTGRSPYRLETATPGELARAITDQEPERPSTATSRADGSGRKLRGDLDVILLKALRKEPDKRYSSAEQLAEDIRRHLEGLPVAARKGTWSYAAGRFVRRHRTAVAAAALVLVTLVAAVVITAREARIADENRRRADARFNDVRKLANSLIFEVHDSIRDLPGATDARNVILQRALQYLDGLARESNHEPDLMRELATGYGRIAALQGNALEMNLGDTKAALASYQKSIELLESLVRENPQEPRDRVELGETYRHYAEFQVATAGDVATAFDYMRRSVAILDREQQASPDDSRVLMALLDSLTRLGALEIGEGLMARVGTMTDAVANLQKSLGLAEHAATLSPPDESLRYREGLVEVFLGDVFFKLGERPESLLHYHRALGRLDPIARRGDNVRAVSNAAVTQGKIGDVFLVDGKLLQALPYYREAQLVQSRLAASDRHNDRLQISEAIGLVELGNVLVGLGRVPEGMEYMRHALVKIQAEPNATSNVRSTEVLIRCWLGGGLERQGDVRAASEQYAAGKELLRPMRAGSTNSPRIQEYYATVTDRLAASLDKLGETDKATDEYEEARRVLEPLVKADPEDQELAYALAETYTALGTVVVERAERSRRREDKLADWQAAAAWFRQALDVWSRIPHPARMSTSGFEVTPPAEVLRRLERCTRELQSAAAAPAPRR